MASDVSCRPGDQSRPAVPVPQRINAAIPAIPLRSGYTQVFLLAVQPRLAGHLAGAVVHGERSLWRQGGQGIVVACAVEEGHRPGPVVVHHGSPCAERQIDFAGRRRRVQLHRVHRPGQRCLDAAYGDQVVGRVAPASSCGFRSVDHVGVQRAGWHLAACANYGDMSTRRAGYLRLVGRSSRDEAPQDGMAGSRAHDADMFLDLRADLVSQATRTLGSVTDAEDIVQEVWFRWRRHQPSVSDARAWLHTVTKNLALDRLRERKSRVYTDLDQTTLTVSRAAIMTRTEAVENMASGFRLILQSQSPLERIVFVLHEGLAWPYTDIARLLARSEQAVRQLSHRARVNLAAGQVRFVMSTRLVAVVSKRYVDVCAGGDVSALLEVLAPDVPLVPAGRRLVEGRLHHEVAGIVLAQGSRLLLCHRRDKLPWYPDVWDVPGGHLMRGEPAAACAVRAARKELGISAVNPTLLAEVSGDDFLMTLMQASTWEGEPHNIAPAQHDAIGFFSCDEASRLRLADRKYLELFDRAAR